MTINATQTYNDWHHMAPNTTQTYNDWWFLNDHDAFSIRYVSQISDEIFHTEDAKNRDLYKLIHKTDNFTQFDGYVEIESKVNYFETNLSIDIQKVNPETNEIDDDESLNTKVQFFLCSNVPDVCEDGSIFAGEEVFASGDSFDDAIRNIAELVRNSDELNNRTPSEVIASMKN